MTDPTAPAADPTTPAPQPAPAPDPAPVAAAPSPQHAAAPAQPGPGSLVRFTAAGLDGLDHLHRGVVVADGPTGYLLVAPLPDPVAVHTDQLTD